MAKPRNRISSPNGATMAPATNDRMNPTVVAGRWQRADRLTGKIGSRTPTTTAVTRMTGTAHSAPPRHPDDGQAIERPDAHRAPVEGTGVDDQQPDQPDVDERLDRDRQERPERTVDAGSRRDERDGEREDDEERDRDRGREDEER